MHASWLLRFRREAFSNLPRLLANASSPSLYIGSRLEKTVYTSRIDFLIQTFTQIFAHRQCMLINSGRNLKNSSLTIHYILKENFWWSETTWSQFRHEKSINLFLTLLLTLSIFTAWRWTTFRGNAKIV